MMLPLEGHVLVVGLGISGLAVARFLVSRQAQGDQVTLSLADEADNEELRRVVRPYQEAGAEVLLGANDVPGRYSLAVVSPGIPPHSPLLGSAVRAADEVVGELEFAFRLSRSPWIAITGTNGKTTTTSLVAHLLASAGVPAATAGNIGNPAVEVAAEANPATAIVAEVSSFQLRMTRSFHPRVAVLLNITPDHVDWHGSMEAYVADKARLFANQDGDDTAIIDVDDPGSAPFADRLEDRGIRVVRVSREGVPAGGAGLADGVLTLEVNGSRVPLIPHDELLIRGQHNISNALAAAAAAVAFGADAAAVSEGLSTFEPIEHRLEPAGEIDGVEYFNDSKATNPDAVLKALTAFPDNEIVLLVGGRNKGNDFAELAREAAGRCKTVVTFGEAGPEIAHAMRDTSGCKILSAGTLAEALAVARGEAVPGDIVLLSPGCASFDEFADFADRGRVFKHLVGLLGKEVAEDAS